jgi:glycosyltransferase involved in cell wall biosynthesis
MNTAKKISDTTAATHQHSFKILYFTVTTDITYDQRMIRICTSLANAGYAVTLVGRKKKHSALLTEQPFKQKRVNCFFEKGKFFYAEYNIRLFFYLLLKKMDGIGAVDLDTILPCYFISRLKKAKRVYDAHELFCEMKEVISRPAVHKIWKQIERYTLPQFKDGYTVNQAISNEFKKMYGVNYWIIKNVPLLQDSVSVIKREKFIIYQGAVNEGRSFETLIPAMQFVNCRLIICGDGNFMEQAQQLVLNNNLQNKVIFKGPVKPDELRLLTQEAYIGVNFVENNGLSNYLSLANKFFDYIHAGIPQVGVDYPAYKEINDHCPVALLTNDLSEKNIAALLNTLLINEVIYNEVLQNCAECRKLLNWQEEEKNLLLFYKKLFE